MADATNNANSTIAPFSRPPGYGPGPLGVPGGTDRSYQVDIIICAAVTTIIGTIFVGLRFYVRLMILRVLQWEDWMILAAQVFSAIMCACFLHMAILGHGSHCWLIPIENFRPMCKTGWLTIVFYALSLWFSQMSILLLYIRIWTFPWVRRAARWLLAIVVVYNICVMVVVATACVPLHAFWDLELQQHSYCHTKAVWWVNTYLHVITDFLIYLVPMPIIVQVRFPRRQKVLLFVLFALGFVVCLISTVRLYLLALVAESLDFTFDNVCIALWTCIETNVTVCVACFMTMKPLLSRWFPNLVEAIPERQNAAVAASNGRIPTIGSRPVRQLPVDFHRSVTASIRGYEAVASGEYRVKNA